MKRLLQNAKLKINACIEDIDFKAPRGIDRSVVLRLATCECIRNAQNIIITGPTGVGKTYLACAFANKAARMGFSAFYIRLSRLFQDLSIARADGWYPGHGHSGRRQHHAQVHHREHGDRTGKSPPATGTILTVRITARGTGASDSTESIVQSTFSVTYP